MLKFKITPFVIAFACFIATIANAKEIIFKAYNDANIIVESGNFTSAVSPSVVIPIYDKPLIDVRIYEIINGQKQLLFEGDVKIKNNFTASAVAFPNNLLLIKENPTDSTSNTSSLTPATLQDINLLIKVLHSSSNDRKRMVEYKGMIKKYAFTVNQLAELISVFKVDDARVDAAVLSYDNVADKFNFMRLFNLILNKDDTGAVIEMN